MTIKWEESVVQHPMGRARGLGSARDGVVQWLHQRVTAVALLPLMGWMVYAAVSMPGWTYNEVTTWLAAPVNAILMILSVMAIFYHAALGMQVVMDDYVHHEGCKQALLIIMKLGFMAAAVASVFSVVKIALG